MGKANQDALSAGAPEKPESQHIEMVKQTVETSNGIPRVDSYLEDSHIKLGWRSGLVVAVRFFA